MKRGDVWFVQLDPTVGREQAGKRPALILSVDEFNASGADLVVVLPITSRARRLPSRVRVVPPDGGLSVESWIICEQPRTISKKRLLSRLGRLAPVTLHAVSDIVCMLLGFVTARS